jgi:predicted DCC family thiol-disulfide oxidoreductase YuxK
MTHVVNYPLTLLYDGACPICALEMDNFRERDQAQNPARKLVFVDIAQPGFDPAPYSATLPEMQALIHAVRPDGSRVVGVPALRLAYQAVGMGAWAAPTGWPLLAPAFGWAYSWFARNRYRFSGALMPLIEHIAARRALRRARACAQGVCEVSSNRPHPCPLPRVGDSRLPQVGEGVRQSNANHALSERSPV